MDGTKWSQSRKQKAESRKQKAESRKQKAESGKRKAESGKRKAESGKRKMKREMNIQRVWLEGSYLMRCLEYEVDGNLCVLLIVSYQRG